MTRRARSRHRLAIIGLLGIVIIFLAVRISQTPLSIALASEDSGVFLYEGWRLLEGDLPYRDFWDHKGPVLFAINAFGVLLSGRTRWGIFLVDSLGLIVGMVVLFRALRRTNGTLAALCGLCVIGAGVQIYLPQGNQAESYAMTFAMIAYALVDSTRRSTHASARAAYITIGVLSALSVFIKFNMIGFMLTIGLHQLLVSVSARTVRTFVQRISWMVIGTLIVAVPMVVYLVTNGILADYLDANITFNLLYASTRRDSLLALERGFDLLPLMILPTLCWLFAAFQVITRKRIPLLVGVALIGFVVEWLLIVIPGRVYDYYYATILPSAGILTAYAMAQTALSVARIAPLIPRRSIIAGFLAVLIVIPSAYSAIRLRRERMTPVLETLQGAASAIDERSASIPSLLAYGPCTALQFIVGSPAPSRWTFPIPLLLVPYNTPERIDEYIGDIVGADVEMIVDCSAVNPFLPPLDQATRDAWRASQTSDVIETIFTPLYAYIEVNYTRVAAVEPLKWALFVRNDRLTP